jgi:hypothetical protein
MIVGGVDGRPGSGRGEMHGLGDEDVGRLRRRRHSFRVSCFLILADLISSLGKKDGNRRYGRSYRGHGRR